MDTVFSLSSLLVLPFWLLMIFAPNWQTTKRLIASPLIILAPALLYAVLVLPQLLELLPVLANPDLQKLGALLTTPQGATIAWVHFLAFDLFVGRWAYLDNFERRLHPVLMGLVLLTVLMFGPFGFVLYLLIGLLARGSAAAKSGAVK